MAEIEHFFDPNAPGHPKFARIAHETLPLLSAKAQVEKQDSPVLTVLSEAVGTGLICNETMAYFLYRTYLFLLEVGINPRNVRFRQHRSNEMAHYACDCWDAEIETSHGWVECVGHANRSAYDLE
jgi:glycyl-tRNA synthetase